MQIVMKMAEARLLLIRGIRSNAFVFAHRGVRNDGRPAESDHPIWDRYDDLTAEALLLFRRGEEHVALWAAVEFYAAAGSVRWAVASPDLPDWGLGLEREGDAYLPPREERMVRWATAFWNPNRNPPRYAVQGEVGETVRHEFVPPNSDVAMDMLRAPIERWRDWPHGGLDNNYKAVYWPDRES